MGKEAAPSCFALLNYYYKQNKQNDDFELYVTKDHFYKAYGTLPTKTPTDFEQLTYVTIRDCRLVSGI